MAIMLPTLIGALVASGTMLGSELYAEFTKPRPAKAKDDGKRALLHPPRNILDRFPDHLNATHWLRPGAHQNAIALVKDNALVLYANHDLPDLDLRKLGRALDERYVDGSVARLHTLMPEGESARIRAFVKDILEMEELQVLKTAEEVPIFRIDSI